MIYRIGAYSAIGIALILLSSCASNPSIEISNASVRHVPPMLRVTAAYLTITNRSNKEISLISLQSPVADKVEIHETVEQDGMVNMAHRRNLTIPANSTVSLKEGGKHLMLTGLKQPVKIGQKILVQFGFDNGTTITATIGVKDMRAPAQPNSGHMHSHGH